MSSANKQCGSGLNVVHLVLIPNSTNKTKTLHFKCFAAASASSAGCCDQTPNPESD